MRRALVSFLDGSGRAISEKRRLTNRRALGTRAGGELIEELY